MSVEELMKPRYKVIADYPANSEPIGFIYEGNNWSKRWHEVMDKMPHLFRKLEWWQQRHQYELPIFVKLNPESSITTIDNDNIVYKVNKYLFEPGDIWIKQDSGTEIHISHLLPATEKEYNDFITAPATDNRNK